MLAAERHWEERGGRPFLPRALSVADAEPPRTASGLDFLLEAVGPGTERLCGLEAGERVWVNGPLGNAFSEPRELAPGRRRGDPRRRRHRDRAAGAPAAAASPTAASRPGSCSASATASTHGGLDDLFSSCQIGLASEDGHAGAPRLRHRPAGGDARGRRRGQRRRLRLRPAADAGGGAGDVRRRAASPASWRSSRRWPAASAPASAAPCRSRRAATCASASTARSVGAATGSREVDPCLTSAGSSSSTR